MPTSARRKRLLWAACLASMAWLVLKVVPAVIHEVRNAQWSLEDKVTLLARGLEELKSVEGMEDSATALRTALVAQAARVVTSGNVTQANDALVGLVSSVVTRANARLNRTEPVTDSAARGYLRRVALLASFDSDIGGAIAVLRSLAEESPVVVVESITIMAPDPNPPAGEPEVLKVEMVVRGWYLTRQGT